MTKPLLRKHHLALRHRLKPKEAPPEKILLHLKDPGYVLSFCSTKGEIDTKHLNEHLANEERLALPKIEGETLTLYSVNDLRELKRGPFDLHEPDPKTCGLLSPPQITYILVPGLAFDHERHRLGYGKGYYDRLLKSIDATTIGLGYKEQLSDRPLPRETHDIALNQLFLF